MDLAHVRVGAALTAGAAAVCLLPPAQAQPTSSVAIQPAAPVVMRWIDLREDSAVAAPYRQLWADRLDLARRKWSASSRGNQPLPAYTLAHVFAAAERPVLASILFNMYDCELPGNGAGADLYARCPMRVVSGPPGATKVTSVARTCHLFVPAVAKPGDGPDPQQNKTTVGLDRGGTLHLRVVQFGRPVPSCDMDIRLE